MKGEKDETKINHFWKMSRHFGSDDGNLHRGMVQWHYWSGPALVKRAHAQQQMQKPPKDNIIDGTLYPHGYTPVEIKNGVYPRDSYPNYWFIGMKPVISPTNRQEQTCLKSCDIYVQELRFDLADIQT